MHYEHLVDGMFSLKNQAFPFTEAIICVVNLQMSHLRAFLAQMSHLRVFLSRMSWFRAFWGRILRRIFGRNSQKYAEFWQKFCGKNWRVEPLVTTECHYSFFWYIKPNVQDGFFCCFLLDPPPPIKKLGHNGWLKMKLGRGFCHLVISGWNNSWQSSAITDGTLENCKSQVP